MIEPEPSASSEPPKRPSLSRHTGCLRSHFSWSDRRWHFGDYVEKLIRWKFHPATAMIIGSMAIHGQ